MDLKKWGLHNGARPNANLLKQCNESIYLTICKHYPWKGKVKSDEE